MARPTVVRTSNPENLKLLWTSQMHAYRALEAFSHQLRNEKVRVGVRDDDNLFAFIVRLAVEDYGVMQIEIAKRLRISPAAVGRWARAVHLPPAYVRQSVLDAIAELIEPHLKAEAKKFERAKVHHDVVVRGRVSYKT